MYKVIIIDDEPLMIEGLLNMIEWNTYGFKISGVANNGEEGLELIKIIEPDLVITDIRMPGMTGLDLIRKCQNEYNYKCQFVVISGYNEFDYIKIAMNLNCVAYILKPIDQDEVHRLLQKIEEGLIEEEKNLDESIDVVIKMTLSRIISEPIKPSVIQRAEFLLNWSSEMAYCYCCLDANTLSKEEQIIHMKTIAKELGCKIIIVGVNNHKTSLFTYGYQEAVEHWSIRTKKHVIESRQKAPYWLMFSQLSNHLLELKEMVYLIDHNVVLGFFQLGSLVDRLDVRYNFTNDLSLLDKYKLKDLIEHSQAKEIEHELVQIFRTIRHKLPEPEFLLLTLDNCSKHLHKIYGQKYQVNQIEDFYHFKQVIREMMTYYKKRQVEASHEVSIDHIKAYVDQYYHQDVRLKEVAKVFGYNSVYLGQLFFKTYGLKYKDYVLKTRVNKAKELLCYTNDSIKQISLTVGFSNPDYFVSKFKSVEGVSPTRYRI